MSYERTGEQLNDKLTKDGFSPYPSMPNKYWNPDGRIVWTDGYFYQESKESGWSKYDEETWPTEK
ncbi:hypothetical protein [uncultured Fibrella sp.]|uniref:hypothetical protein n=1 Tax=uncultured Fibrella sp. TaxID=1284596 RepID=UPI0035CBCB06